MNVDPVSSGDTTHITNRSVGPSHRMRRLPVDFIPSEDDVICGRGKKCYSHIGNDRFKIRVHSVLGLYRSARTKLDKSKVLNMVVEQVRQNSPSGGFVKQDETGRWHEVGDFLAREKTSQVFRDALHENYKSSSVSKKKRRQEELSKASDKLKMPRSTMDIARKIESMSLDMKNSVKISPRRSDSLPNDDVMAKFHHASRNMRHDSTTQERSTTFGESRISNANVAGFSFEFEPDEWCDDHRRNGRTVSFSRTTRNTMEETLGEMLTSIRYGESRVNQRAASVPNVPPGSFDYCDEPNSHCSEDVHHSLPNIHFEADDFAVDETERLYQSAPNLGYFSSSDLLQSDDAPIYGSEAAVPATIEFQRLRGGTHPVDLLGRVERGSFMNEAQLPSVAMRGPANDLLGSMGRGFVHGQRPGVAVAAGIMSSLENFAGVAMEDDNPFEPIPIGQSSIRSNQTTNCDEQERIRRLQP
ncbi:hypothetical protein ACA910_020690 [Epithemia clementina (nom. ined.)]